MTHEVLEGEVICGVQACACICVLKPGHPGEVHQCRPLTDQGGCGGSWKGEWKKADADADKSPEYFVVVTLPLSGRPPSLANLFVDLFG